MNSNKALSVFAKLMAAMSMLLLAFLLVKEYSSLTISDTMTSSVALFISLLSIILFAFFSTAFSRDLNIRSAGFILFLASMMEFLAAAMACMPAAKSNMLITVLAGAVAITGFVLLIVGLFNMSRIEPASGRLRTSSRCFAIVKLLSAVVAIAGSIIVSQLALNDVDVESLKGVMTKLQIVFGKIVPVIASSWFYWELGRWIKVCEVNVKTHSDHLQTSV